MAEQAADFEQEQEIRQVQQDADYLESVLTCPGDLTPGQGVVLSGIFNHWQEVFTKDLIYTTDARCIIRVIKDFAYGIN